MRSTVYAAILRQWSDALAASPHTDVESVNRVKEKLAHGSYEIDPDRVADKLLVFERALLSNAEK